MAQDNLNKYKVSGKTTEQYSDIPINFNPHPNTKDLLRVTDGASVNRSIRNLLLMSQYEDPYKPRNGSRLRDLLFEIPSAGLESEMAEESKKILIDEPRIKVNSIKCTTYMDKRSYNITIDYTLLNNPNLLSTSLTLKRIR